METGDNPRSEVYNLNLSQLDADISRFYKEISTIAEAQVKSFNFAKIVNEEITKRADQLASTVLDLKILSDFTRGDVIIAGDDFRNLDNVDSGAASGAPKAEKMFGSGGMALRRTSNRSLTNRGTKVEILFIPPVAPQPVAPQGLDPDADPNSTPPSSNKGGATAADTGDNQGTTKPTPGNLQRFYEGNYYNFMGQARPEGGHFNIKYQLQPDLDKKAKVTVTKDPTAGGGGGSTHTTTDDSDMYSTQNAGFYVELGATEGVKRQSRTRMFDDDPSTFWEAEYVYHVPSPLLGSTFDESSIQSDSNSDDSGHQDKIPRTASVVLDYKAAELAAKAWDFEGRDLIMDMVITLDEQTSVNYVVLDPILFGATAFIEVLGIHTASKDDGQFTIIDGWDASRYAKTINPEANEFLNETQVGQLLSPSRYEYTGKGVFPFPSRLAKKIRIRLKVDNPVATPYERYYILMRHQADIETEIHRHSKKGIFR